MISEIYEPHLSENRYRLRLNRSAHDAMNKVLENLNEGYEWVIYMDIEKKFATVHHDKLISILREHVNEREVLYLIHSFLKAVVMENELTSPNESGVSQGGPLSPILSSVYLDKFDKELEARGLCYVRYSDDSNVFVKSEMVANRVMKSVLAWLERSLFLKVNTRKTKIVRPIKSNFLGFTFWKSGDKWKCNPSNDWKIKLCPFKRKYCHG